MSFQGTENYIATRALQVAVNAAVTLQKPLLIKGEPGTGKTLLAYEVAAALGKSLYSWNVKSTTTAQQGLYEYDAVARLRDSQLSDGDINDIEHYIKKGKLWEAFDSEEQVVLLIDEIDKADIEFPNDLLNELDKMEFYCYELKRTIKAKHRPIIIITSNNEKELPDAFLRRCFFHYISFPDRETMKQIVDVHYPALEEKLITNTMAIFYGIRDIKALKKKPSTSELIDWIKLLLVGKVSADLLEDFQHSTEIPPYIGALLKNEQDTGLYEAIRNKTKRPY
ncbi:MAG: MoxR family ATPase [Bacteroidota bacterium]|jgi:MoxR-like ATPase